jgi:hypothetical protein
MDLFHTQSQVIATHRSPIKHARSSHPTKKVMPLEGSPQNGPNELALEWYKLRELAECWHYYW